VAILDIVVAWALYILLVPANKNLSALAAWLRVIYGGIFIFAISKLYMALQVITTDGAQAMTFLKAFRSIWDNGLIIFGFHLLVLGYLAFKSGYVGSCGIYRGWFRENALPCLQLVDRSIHLYWRSPLDLLAPLERREGI
jgi:hypothetical protein